MNVIGQYFERTIKGMEQYFLSDKTLVILVAALLLLWLWKVKGITRQGNRMLVYTAGMTFVLLCPLTAVLVVAYQSAFYDYEWAWSMVPVLIVIAYAAVLVYDDKLKKKSLNIKIPVFLTMLVWLLFCGNQGQLQRVDAKEADYRLTAREVVACVTTTGELERPVLWAPREIMQEVRRTTGEFVLIYGRDMWDAKSGAYDYEVYFDELVCAYEWMETAHMLSAESAAHTEVELYRIYKLDETVEATLETVLTAGANTLVLPIKPGEYFEACITEKAEEHLLSVQKIDMEQYVIYLLK